MLLPVRLSSVTFMHRTQSVEIFGNIYTSFDTMAIRFAEIVPGEPLRRSG